MATSATGLIGALITARIMFGKADLTMALNGALAGLVAITAEPSTPTALQISASTLSASPTDGQGVAPNMTLARS